VDVSVVVAKALARPVNAMFSLDDDASALRRMLSSRPENGHDAGIQRLAETLAWLMLGAFHLLFAVVFSLVDGLLPRGLADAVWAVGQSSLVVCMLTGVFRACRAGAAWYLTDERWQRRGLTYRLATGSGTVDLLLALALVSGFNLLNLLG
jgi:hypothetical protein